jgi:hypothetical protein
MDLRHLLESVSRGDVTPEEAEARLAGVKKCHGFAELDLDRERRCGFPEVVYCERKGADQVAAIFAELAGRHPNALGTRATREQFEAVRALVPDAEFNLVGRTIKVHRDHAIQGRGEVVLVSAGTADREVLEEARETSHVSASHPGDPGCGVAGSTGAGPPHTLERAAAIVVIAGMDGALPRSSAGLSAPVIAVPVSVGYGIFAASRRSSRCSTPARRGSPSSTSTTFSWRLRRVGDQQKLLREHVRSVFRVSWDTSTRRQRPFDGMKRRVKPTAKPSGFNESMLLEYGTTEL